LLQGCFIFRLVESYWPGIFTTRNRKEQSIRPAASSPLIFLKRNPSLLLIFYVSKQVALTIIKVLTDNSWDVSRGHNVGKSFTWIEANKEQSPLSLKSNAGTSPGYNGRMILRDGRILQLIFSKV
jgi:hypothetical protein